MKKEYLKFSYYGTENFTLEDEFKMEYGDVLYSILSLADELNIDANECLEKALSKYKTRIFNHSSMGSESEKDD